MATSNDTRTTPRTPTVPVAWLDGMNDLNHRLEAFQLMHYAWLNMYLKDASDTRYEAISSGVHDMLGDMLEGYQHITDQIKGLMESYRLAGIEEENDHE